MFTGAALASDTEPPDKNKNGDGPDRTTAAEMYGLQLI